MAIEMGGGQAGAYARFVLKAMQYSKKKIQIQFDEQLAATMTGPVAHVCDGRIADEILN